MSATDARVHFGEVLKAVAESGDSVIVERAGQPLAVVIPLADYERIRGGRELRARWDRSMERMRELREYLAAERAAGRLKDFDFAEAIRRGREERDEQLLDALR